MEPNISNCVSLKGKTISPFWGKPNDNTAEEIHLPLQNHQPVEAFSILPPPPDAKFVGRPEIIKWLRQKFERSLTRVALVGPAGVGKSQIALQYAHQILKSSPSTFVFWIEASDRSHFENAFRDIARRLQLPSHDDPDIDALPLVSSWLSQPENGTWLMVVDSVENTDVFYCRKNNHSRCVGRSCLPTSPNGSIIFTSRNPSCLLLEMLDGDLEFYNATYKVPVMNIYQGFQLLRNELDAGLGDNPSRMADLVYALGCEPRSITQAAKVLNFRGLKISEMSEMEEFRDLWPEKHGKVEKRGCLPKAWHRNFQLLRQQRSQAVDLLYLMSFFSGPQRNIPKLVLVSFAKRLNQFQDLSEEAVIHYLDQELAFLKENYILTETDGGEHIVLAPFVGFCTQMWLFYLCEQGLWKGRLLYIMAQEYSSGVWDSWQLFEKLDDCLQAVISLKIWSRLDKLNAATITLSLANYRSNQGRFKEAESLLRNVIEIRGQSLGLDDLETVRAMENIGTLFHVQGKLGEAEQTLRLVLEVKERVLGREHKDTLCSAFALANLFLKLGDFADAERRHRETLVTLLQVLGKDHFHTLTSLDGLGETLRLAGILEESERTLHRAVDGKMRALGAENPHTISSVYGLAATLMCQGKHEHAEKLYRQGLEGCEKALGRYHPTTQIGIHGLIHSLEEQHKDEEAHRVKQSIFGEGICGVADSAKFVGENDIIGPVHRCHIDILVGL
ncbi:unnamed protein product [Clonostachys byssicola]|uniref:AAA+ ATPase domain-containing protein n=1 Tax=Clonostachys byssicola TaxID=160290 RepID=A0A9N9U566_9HYPO|nr:unnamed protein product [Clonostachys byssicola]